MKILKRRLAAVATLMMSFLLVGCGNSASVKQIAQEQNGGEPAKQANQGNNGSNISQNAQQSHQTGHNFLGLPDSSKNIKKPADKFIMPTITPNIKKQLTAGGAKLSYDGSGAITINNGPQLNTKVSSAPYVQLPKPNPAHHNRLEGSARAWLNKSSRQYKNREETGNGRGSYKPLGFIQRMNLDSSMSGYNHLYDRGHLIAYAIAGNVKGFDASESNKNNIVTQTAWANECGDSQQGTSVTGEGQNYFEGKVRKDLDENPQDSVMYQVTPIYDGPDDIIPRGIHLQASDNKYGQLFNVYVPNAQNGIQIDYHTGRSKVVGIN